MSKFKEGDRVRYVGGNFVGTVDHVRDAMAGVYVIWDKDGTADWYSDVYLRPATSAARFKVGDRVIHTARDKCGTVTAVHEGSEFEYTVQYERDYSKWAIRDRYLELAPATQPEVPESTSLTAISVLRTAADTIEQRGKQRDQPTGERSMARCVNSFWTLYGEGILKRGHMTETEGWEFMSILKKARKAGGVYTADDYLDDIAYCALSAESEAALNKEKV